MAAVTGVPQSPEAEQIKSEIEAVLRSDAFLRAPSLAQFLSYVCRKALSGEADQIKEYNIAVEAFGRSPNFDQKEDAIVRVEAHRLRKRLKSYYEAEGASHSVRIVIPAGQYVPMFVFAKPGELSPPEADTAEIAEDDAPTSPATDLALVRPAPIDIPSVPVEEPRRSRSFIPAALAIAVIAGLVAVLLSRHSAPPPAASVNDGGSGPAAGMASGTQEEGIRIACGLTTPKYVDVFGNTWLGDRYFLGGQILSSPVDSVVRSRDAALFRNRREGDFRYDIPLDPGVYELHLLFAERVFGAGNIAGGGETSRLFHVWANGTPILENLDVISDAAGSNTADVRVFKDISPAPDGFLHLRFSPFKELAFVNGIVLLPTTPGKIRPVRMCASTTPVRDAAGRLWSAEQYSVGGQLIGRSSSVTGTDSPELYHSERYGHFNFAIPVAEGRYTVTLYFAETWFGPTKPSKGGEGSRLFDVYCNGSTLLKNFDVYKTAGEGDRAVEKSFRGLTPNAQGKLVLNFVPVRNYATVNAIEVVPES
jgi:Malectin domain